VPVFESFRAAGRSPLDVGNEATEWLGSRTVDVWMNAVLVGFLRQFWLDAEKVWHSYWKAYEYVSNGFGTAVASWVLPKMLVHWPARSFDWPKVTSRSPFCANCSSNCLTTCFHRLSTGF
jgi:hypothetical protein